MIPNIFHEVMIFHDEKVQKIWESVIFNKIFNIHTLLCICHKISFNSKEFSTMCTKKNYFGPGICQILDTNLKKICGNSILHCESGKVLGLRMYAMYISMYAKTLF